MGMYSTLVVRATLKADTPDSILNPLRWLLHKTDRGENWTKCPCPDGNAFFDLERHHQIGEDYEAVWRGKIYPISTLERNEDGTWAMTARSHCKNYNQQFQAFLAWIDPWIVAEADEQIGFYHHEELARWRPVRKGSGVDHCTKLGYHSLDDPLTE
jgi:hypothetical protein